VGMEAFVVQELSAALTVRVLTMHNIIKKPRKANLLAFMALS
jgi:hypothetical protein